MSEDDAKRKHFQKFLDNASRIVASWPTWKQNILANANKSTVDTPRKPIIQDDGY